MMYGKAPPNHKWQGWTKVDIADIPDNATITQASLFYYVVSPSEPAPHTYVTLIDEDPVSAEPDVLWNDIAKARSCTGYRSYKQEKPSVAVPTHGHNR